MAYQLSRSQHPLDVATARRRRRLQDHRLLQRTQGLEDCVGQQPCLAAAGVVAQGLLRLQQVSFAERLPQVKPQLLLGVVMLVLLALRHHTTMVPLPCAAPLAPLAPLPLSQQALQGAQGVVHPLLHHRGCSSKPPYASIPHRQLAQP